MFKGNFGQILNNLTWGLVTNTVGNLVAHGYNLAGQVDGVTHLAGATAIETKGSGNPFTVGSYITGPKGFKADWKDHLFVHEYGHYIQSQWFGPLYIPIVAVSSVASVAGLGGDDHGSRWFEVQASRMGGKYFDERYGSGASGYVQGSRDYFDYDAFGRGGLTAYTNERRNSRDQGRGHQTSGARFSVWDIIAPVFPIPTLTLSLFTKKKK